MGPIAFHFVSVGKLTTWLHASIRFVPTGYTDKQARLISGIKTKWYKIESRSLNSIAY